MPFSVKQPFEWASTAGLRDEVLQAISSGVRKYQRFPNKEELIDQLDGMEPEVLDVVMSDLVVDNKLVEDEAGWYLFAPKKKPEPPIIPEAIIRRTTKPAPVPARPKKNKIDKEGSVYGVPVYIIQAVMAVIGIGASIISVYYTTIWLLEFLPAAFALLLSGIMVGFCVTAFETVILFMSGYVTEGRVTKVVISLGFIFLWLVVTAFSIMSTVAGQYNRHVDNLREYSKQGASVAHSQWLILQEQKTELQSRLSEYREQMKVLNNIMKSMGDLESRSGNNKVWHETQFRLQNVGKQMSGLSIELDKVREKEREQISESRKTGAVLHGSAEDIPDFYGWMSKVTGADRDKVQFWMSLFPAVFVDIIAPVSLAIALFLRRRKR